MIEKLFSLAKEKEFNNTTRLNFQDNDMRIYERSYRSVQSDRTYVLKYKSRAKAAFIPRSILRFIVKARIFDHFKELSVDKFLHLYTTLGSAIACIRSAILKNFYFANALYDYHIFTIY
jgi:hypothetical protein